MSAFENPVRDFQLWSNALVRDKRLPYPPIAVKPEPATHRPDKATAARVPEMKRCLGWLNKYATPEITDTLLRILQAPDDRSRYQSQAQFDRGLKHRAWLRNGRPTARAALAAAVCRHPNAIFAYSSPTGGTARAGLIAASEGRKSYVAATRGWTDIDVKLLVFLWECCQRGPTWINCVTNGSHRSGSGHYGGYCGDIDKATSRSVVYAAAKAAGVRVLDEDRFHFHVYTTANP